MTNVSNQPVYPQGPTQSTWHRHGYVAAMADIQTLLDEGADLERIQQWVRDNGATR